MNNCYNWLLLVFQLILRFLSFANGKCEKELTVLSIERFISAEYLWIERLYVET